MSSQLPFRDRRALRRFRLAAEAGEDRGLSLPRLPRPWVNVAMQADPVAPEQCIDAFNATDFRPELASPGAKLVEYEGVSHGLVVTEADRVTRDLLNFIG